MNANENIRSDTPEDIIELGTASTETKGSQGRNEPTGPGGVMIPGISEE